MRAAASNSAYPPGMWRRLCQLVRRGVSSLTPLTICSSLPQHGRPDSARAFRVSRPTALRAPFVRHQRFRPGARSPRGPLLPILAVSRPARRLSDKMHLICTPDNTSPAPPLRSERTSARAERDEAVLHALRPGADPLAHERKMHGGQQARRPGRPLGRHARAPPCACSTDANIHRARRDATRVRRARDRSPALESLVRGVGRDT